MTHLKLHFHRISLITAISVIIFCFSARFCQADEKQNKEKAQIESIKKKIGKNDKRIFWTPIRLGVWEGICLPNSKNVCPLYLCVGENPNNPSVENMYGIAIGGMYSTQNLYGMLFSLIYLGGAETNYGLVLEGSIAITKINYGVSLGCVGSVVKEKNYGVAAAVIGAGGSHNEGLAVGGIVAGTLKKGANYGLLVSPLITLTNENHGIQFSLFNWADKGDDGLQIGLLNHNPDGFLPWFPFVNF